MTKALYIAWQDPDSRSWSPVGRLTRDASLYKFVYTRGAEQAGKKFQPFGRMRDLHVAYQSEELFPLFANRVLPKSRPEYQEYMEWLGLSKQDRDVMDELSRTGGLRATDSLEMFPCPVPDANKNYEVYFFSRGLRHMNADNQERARRLKPGENLYLMQDLQNEFDSMALLVRTGDPISLVGYAPQYYSSEFTQLLRSAGQEEVKVSVERVNSKAPLQYRVLCKLSSPWPSNFAPCSKGPYEALA